MHRTDGPGTYDSLPVVRDGAAAPGYFGPGDPATGRKGTRVTYEWANSVQEELCTVVEAAGLTLDKADNSQLLQAIRQWLSPQYELCTTVYPRLCAVNKPGFVPVNGTLIVNAVNIYPEAWAYLQTVEGLQMCVTEAAWQALTKATWHTCADGSKIGWNGVGGAPKYVVDTAKGTLRVPDLRGMTDEVAGYDSLGVGGVRGDLQREIVGTIDVFNSGYSGVFTHLANNGDYANGPNRHSKVLFNSRDVVPVGPRNHGPRWISDARVYLGPPAL